MLVKVSSELDCSPEMAWTEVQKSSLLLYVIRPLVRISAERGTSFPATWTQGLTVRWRSYLFGFIPWGDRTTTFEKIDQARKEIQTREQDAVIQRWDHLISISALPNGKTLHSDKIEIEAGVITVFVWLWAQWFYRHRHGRWRKLARSYRK
jgi:hypothetical protein